MFGLGSFIGTFLDLIQKLSNHPLHIITEDNKLSPSAFIPFCAYGWNTLMLSLRVNQFHTPVCNSFKAKIFNNQLCYEVDVSRLVSKHNMTKEQQEENLKIGLTFLMDYNEDRQGDYGDKIDAARKEEDFVGNLGMSFFSFVLDHTF